jgi:hypothetical protein
VQRLRLWDPVVLAYLGGMTALVAGLVALLLQLDREALELQSSLANLLIFTLIVAFVALGRAAA